MKPFMAILCCYICIATAAQPTVLPSGKPDTSYSVASVYREYEKMKNNFTGLEMVREFVSDSFKTDKNRVYLSRGERKLQLDVFRPGYKTKGKRIPILLIHGGGWRSGNRAMHYPLAQKLAMMGYVCVVPEYRLSTEALFPAAVYDLKAALRWLLRVAKKYNLDTSKIVVMGHSAGGELAAFLGNINNNNTAFDEMICNTICYPRVSAVVDMDGILAFIHPESGEGDDSKKTSAATQWFGVSKTENPQLWQQGSPLTHAGKQSPPALFINSAVARMHAGRDDYIQIMNRHHIYTEVKTFEGAPHYFCFFEPWFTPMVQYIDHFLKKIFPSG